jgi:hypothetical protein
MAERPNQNWEARQIDSRGPSFRIDVKNPQMGFNGPDLYNFYSTNDSKDVNLVGFSDAGTYHIYNDRLIEIIGGSKNEEDGSIDINIAGLNGDVCITAARNGRVRIKAKNVQIEASEDLDLKAGRNITLKAVNGRILQDSNKCDIKALTGNAAPETFGMKVFKNSFIGLDLIKTAFTIDLPLIGGVEIGF